MGTMYGTKTLTAVLFCGGTLALLGAVPADAAPAWLSPGNLSEAGRDATNPTVASDSAGDTVAAWERQLTTGPGIVVQAATRAPGGSFTSPVTLGTGSSPLVAITPTGEALVAWWHFALALDLETEKAHYELLVAARAPGAAGFSPAVEATALPPSVLPSQTDLEADAAGDVALAWMTRDPESAIDPSDFYVESTVRPAGGSFAAPELVSPEPTAKEEDSVLGGAAIDAAGELTVVWDQQLGSSGTVEAASRPPAGSFSAPVEVNPPPASGESAVAPAVGSDAAGDVTVVWQAASPRVSEIEFADRAGGGYSAPQRLSAVGAEAFAPQIAVAPDGAASAIWPVAGTAVTFVEAVTRAGLGSGFTAPESISSADGEVLGPRLAIGSGGDVAVAWSQPSGGEEVVEAALGKAGAGFAAPQAVSALSPEFMRPEVAIDGFGDATAIWPRSDGNHTIAQYAGYDAFAPRIDGLSIPSSGTVGVPVSFAAGPFDVWPIGPARFDFGDGGSATGASVEHTYAAPGSYRVTVTASDAAGTATSAEGTIAIVPSNRFSLGKLVLDRKRGTAKLSVAVPGPGAVTLSGANLAGTRARASGAATLKLPVRARGAGLRKLRRKGKLKVAIKVVFTPTGGTAASRTRHAALIRKRS